MTLQGSSRIESQKSKIQKRETTSLKQSTTYSTLRSGLTKSEFQKVVDLVRKAASNNMHAFLLHTVISLTPDD